MAVCLQGRICHPPVPGSVLPQRHNPHNGFWMCFCHQRTWVPILAQLLTVLDRWLLRFTCLVCRKQAHSKTSQRNKGLDPRRKQHDPCPVRGLHKLLFDISSRQAARPQGVEGTELHRLTVWAELWAPRRASKAEAAPSCPVPPPGATGVTFPQDEFKGVDCTLFFLALEFCCQDQFPNGLGMSHPGSTAWDSVNESGMLAAVGRLAGQTVTHRNSEGGGQATGKAKAELGGGRWEKRGCSFNPGSGEKGLGVWEDPNLQRGTDRNSEQSVWSGKSTFLQAPQRLHHSFAMHRFLFMLTVTCTFSFSLLWDSYELLVHRNHGSMCC